MSLTSPQIAKIEADFANIAARRRSVGPQAAGFVIGLENEYANYLAAGVAASTYTTADASSWALTSGYFTDPVITSSLADSTVPTFAGATPADIASSRYVGGDRPQATFQSPSVTGGPVVDINGGPAAKQTGDEFWIF